MKHCRDLAKRLVGEGYGVILTGSQAEREQFERACGPPSDLGTGLRDLMGQLTVRELMAIIRTATSWYQEQLGRRMLRQPWTYLL